MAMTSQDDVQVEARERATKLLKDRHERESEALAALMAAVSRRARAQEIVERETEEIATRLTEMSRLGFDDQELASLGVDVAAIRVTQAPEMPDPPAHEGRGQSDEHQADGDGETIAHREAAASDANPSEHVGGVRTTAHLTGTVTNRSAGLNRRPW